MTYTDAEAIDHERLFHLIHDEAWTEAAQVLHRHYRLMSVDPLLQRASEAFVSSLAIALETPALLADRLLLEQLFLLHTGRFLALPEPLFERVVEGLVRMHAADPEAALAYARHFPSNASCAAILDTFEAPSRHRLEFPNGARVQVAEGRSSRPVAIRPLLRSAQEDAFFRAVRDAFPTLFVYPNVALSAVLEFELLQPRLTPDERQYFFRALVDCVVFEPGDRWWPRFFLELDSPLHDDVDRQKRDHMKDRILTVAGQRLFRIRAGADRSQDGLTRLVRAAMLVEAEAGSPPSPPDQQDLASEDETTAPAAQSGQARQL